VEQLEEELRIKKATILSQADTLAEYKAKINRLENQLSINWFKGCFKTSTKDT